jgi:hypothetical protein
MSTDVKGRHHTVASAHAGGQYQIEAKAEPVDVSLTPDPAPAVREAPTYDFPTRRLPDAIARIDAANKKLERAGIDARFTYTSKEYLKHSTQDAYGFPRRRHTYELLTKLSLSEPAIAYGGWTFVAALDATESGFIARTAPGQSLDGWRPEEQVCDHCGLVRLRKSTYIVRDGAGSPYGMSRGLVVTRPFDDVESSPHDGHADAARSAVTTCTTRPPNASLATSRTANPSRSNNRDTADTAGSTLSEPP